MDVELPLRQRVAQSARGLACSTFSGVAGIETGLRDPRTGGKQQIRSDSNYQHAPVVDRSRARPYRQTSDSKTPKFATGSRSGVAKDAELDFQRFSVERSYPVNQISEHTPIASDDVDYELHATTHNAKTWHFDNGQDLEDRGLALADSKHNECIAITDLQDACDVHQGLRMSAVERLEQLQHHLPTALLRTGTKFAEASPSYAKNLFDQPYRPSMNHYDYHEEVLPSRTAAVSDHPHEDPITDNEHSAREFHCPYMDCHLNLNMHNSTVALSEQRMHCIHITCDYISQTSEHWMEHVTTPHHDLQILQHHVEVMAGG